MTTRTLTTDSLTTEVVSHAAVVDEMAQWLAANDDYLATAVRWLRLRLARLAEAASPLGSNGQAELGSPANHFLAPTATAEIERAAAQMDAAAAMEPPPALLILAQRFGLSPFEQAVLLLCVAVELDTRIAPLCAQAQQRPEQPHPTFALAMTLFDDPAWDVLSPERPLRYWRLLEIHQPGAQPLTTSPLRADERIVNYVKGLNYLDDRLAPLLMPFDAPAGNSELPPSQQGVAAALEKHLEQALRGGQSPVIQLVGLDPISKQLVAQQVAAWLNLHLRRLPVTLLPADAAELETLARLWQRESILMPIALFVDTHEQGGDERSDNSPLAALAALPRFLARSQGIFFVSSREARSDLGANVRTVQVEKPTPAEQRAAWAGALGDGAGNLPALLAGQFNLNLSTIQQVVQQGLADANRGNGVGGHTPHTRLWDLCLTSAGPRMDLLAQRLHPKATWDDIVLPGETELLLRQLADQVRQRSVVYDGWGFRQKLSRGLGINALFAGDSGTGKTMAAEVLAGDLRLNLYRIDLSGVVSKYIGETEKNLRRLVKKEDGGAILFFDEADALFGKRSEVKDSHDRYANIEINYLLQRMESYSGLAILATNMKSALDEAFLRRLRFIINFAFPGQRERKGIWQRVFPAQTPIADLDYERLARFNLSGGSINNIALNAAFLSAQQGEPVTMPVLLEAVRAEYRKLDRPIKEADFQWP